MGKKDYLPGAFAPLADMLANLLNKVSAAQIRLGISTEALAALQVAINEYIAAHNIAKDPESTISDKKNRQDAAEVAKAVTRDFVNVNLRFNHALTNADRESMRLTIPDTTPTPVTVPTTFPEVKIYHPAPATVEIQFKDSESPNKAKPAGVHGAEVRWAILDTEPVDWDELNHSSFATRSPVKLTFHGQDFGKTLYFALRWENTRGQKGPWLMIQKTIIS